MKIIVVPLVLMVLAYVQGIDRQHLHPVSRLIRPVTAGKEDTQASKNGYRSARPKVVGGETVKLGQIPFQVSIDSDNGVFCGGVIIHPYYILTTALCVEGGKMFTIYAGVVNLHGNESSGVVVQSLEKYIHEYHIPQQPIADIALLKLSQELPFSKYISAALLPFNNDTYEGELLWISGWGDYYDNEFSKLQHAPLEVLPVSECAKYYPDWARDSTICAEGTLHEGACSGDQGGPLHKILPGESPAMVVGLFSGTRVTYCGFSPTIFTRVSSYTKWILDHINS